MRYCADFVVAAGPRLRRGEDLLKSRGVLHHTPAYFRTDEEVFC